MRIRLMADGRVLDGTPLQIVQTMHFLAAWKTEHLSDSEYIDWACGEAARMLGAELRVEGEDVEDRAASFVDAMLEAGLAERA